MKTRRNRTLSSHSRSTETGESKAKNTDGKWKVKESSDTKLCLVQISKKRHVKRSKKTRKTKRNGSLLPSSSAAAAPPLPLQSSLQSKKKVPMKTYDTKLKSTWPVNDAFPKIILTRIQYPEPSNVSPLKESQKRQHEKNLQPIEHQAEKSLNVTKENRTENRLPIDNTSNLFVDLKRIAASYGCTLTNEQLVLSCFTTNNSVGEHQVVENNVESEGMASTESRKVPICPSNDAANACPAPVIVNQEPLHADDSNVASQLMTPEPGRSSQSRNELNAESNGLDAQTMPHALNTSLAINCLTNDEGQIGIVDTENEEVSVDSENTDKDNQLVEFDDKSVDISENRSIQESILESQLVWTDESEDEADFVSTVNQEPCDESETGALNQLMTIPNDHLAEDNAAPSDDELGGEFLGWYAIPAEHNTLHALKNSLANESSSNDQRQIGKADAANDEILQNCPPSSDTNSIAEINGWNQLPNDVDANAVLIDLTLDDDDFGHNSAGNAANQAHSTKPRPNRRQTYAGLRNKRQKSRSGQKDIGQAQPTKPKPKRRQTFAGIGNKKSHKCSSCEFSTHDKTKFEQHIRTHSTVRPFACTICTKSFARFATLQQHLKIHTRRTFLCTICRRELASEKARKLHEILCKNGLRQYECFLCKKYAHHKNHLDKHMRTHVIHPYCCPKCFKQLNSKLSIKQHMMIKHADSFPFQCNVCFQVFLRRDKWEPHQNRCKLKQYVCDICDRYFVSNFHLVYHSKQHVV